MNSTATYTWNGIVFSEINLFITDLVIVCVALFCYNNTRQNPAVKGYSFFFLFTAISALGAGFGHLLTFYAGQYLKVVSWIFSLVANFYIIQSSGQYLTNNSHRKTLYTFSIVKIVIALCLLLFVQQFFIITIDTVISIALISLPIHYTTRQQTGNKGHVYVCYGIVFTMLTAVVGGLKLSISDEWFNQKDINHMVICGGLLLMQKGVKQL